MKTAPNSASEEAQPDDVLETSFRMKDNFLAGISHEIRTSMNGIIGLAELLQSSKLDADQNEKVRMIQACGQDLLKLINEVLDFSELESGKIQINKRDFNFKDMLQDAVRTCEIDAVKKGLRLSYTIDSNVPEALRGDSARLRQIVMSLIRNAIKSTSVGEVTLHAKPSESSTPRVCEVQIDVKDTGLGQHNDNFDLGLMISHRLCEKMNGRIWFDAVPTIGTTSHFTFRAEICPTLTVVKENNSAADVTVVPATLNILVVEDDRVHQTVVQGLLQKLGHDTDLASDGVEALSMLMKKVYDVVFIDCHLPLMDGFAIAKAILADPALYSQPKIVALTASALEEDKQRCFAAGMDEFLSKPVLTIDLKKILIPLQKESVVRHKAVQSVLATPQTQTLAQSQAATQKQTQNLTADQAPTQVQIPGLTLVSVSDLSSTAVPVSEPPSPAVTPVTPINEMTTVRSSESEIDLDTFYKAFARIEHITGTVIRQFLNDYPVILDQIGKAIQTKDHKALLISAHSLKGMLAEIYAPSCHKLSFELEQMGKTGKTAQAQTAFEQLSEKLKNVETELLQIKSIPKAG